MLREKVHQLHRFPWWNEFTSSVFYNMLQRGGSSPVMYLKCHLENWNRSAASTLLSYWLSSTEINTNMNRGCSLPCVFLHQCSPCRWVPLSFPHSCLSNHIMSYQVMSMVSWHTRSSINIYWMSKDEYLTQSKNLAFAHRMLFLLGRYRGIMKGKYTKTL